MTDKDGLGVWDYVLIGACVIGVVLTGVGYLTGGWEVKETERHVAEARQTPLESLRKPAPPSPSVAAKLTEIPSSQVGRYINGLSGRNKVVMVFGTWCGPCRKDMPGFAQMKLDPQDRLIAVAINDTRKNLEPYLKAYKNRPVQWVRVTDRPGPAFSQSLASIGIRFGYRTTGTPFYAMIDGYDRVREQGRLTPRFIRQEIGKL